MSQDGRPVRAGVPARFGVPARLAAALVGGALAVAACGNGTAPETEPPSEPPPAVPPAPAAPEATPQPQPADQPEPTAGPEPQAEPAGESATGSDAATDTSDPPDGAEPTETAAPAGLSPTDAARLGSLLGELAGIAADWNPTGRAAVAVVSADGALYGMNEHRQHVSASAVKPLWTAAAIDSVGVDAVAPLAHPALVLSDNFAAGEILDLVGIDAVNAWTSDVAGLTGTHLAAWYFGTDRFAQSVLDGGSRANLTTVADLALFYARLRRGELLPAGGSAALESWLRATERGSVAPGAVRGALLARLPTQATAEAIHKTGWLPPYCCPAEVRLVIDAGVVPLPDGGWFAIAAMSDRGEAYNLSVQWVALAACEVYVLLAGDETHTCERAGDGVPRPELWPPPPEPEPEPSETDEADEAESPADRSDATEIPSDTTEIPAGTTETPDTAGDEPPPAETPSEDVTETPTGEAESVDDPSGGESSG